MLAFFATIGLSQPRQPAGRRQTPIVVVGLLLLQNALSIGMATLLGLDPLMGPCWPGRLPYPAATAPRAAMFKLSFERYGCQRHQWRWPARLSAVPGGLIGGPVARYLVALPLRTAHRTIRWHQPPLKNRTWGG